MPPRNNIKGANSRHSARSKLANTPAFMRSWRHAQQTRKHPTPSFAMQKHPKSKVGNPQSILLGQIDDTQDCVGIQIYMLGD
jgi:hypothetical protein